MPAPATSRIIRPFSIAPHDSDAPASAISRVLCRIVDRILGLSELNALYVREWLSRHAGQCFSQAALEILGVTVEVELAPDANLPDRGGVLVVANHPHGALDGLVLMAALERARPDVRIVGNHLLGRIPELRSVCYFVDPFQRHTSVRPNATALREAVRWVRGGGALIVFPAGVVSHVPAVGGTLVDTEWHPMVARLAERTGADVLPVFVQGRNSRLFQRAGRVHPLLRTALLARELLRQRGHTVRVVVGRCISAARLGNLPDAASRTAYLRMRTYALGPKTTMRNRRLPPAPVARAVAPDLLSAEIDALPAQRRLVRAGDCDVICAPGPELPTVLRELGRLRELTFRVVGEGTGRALDLDEFDIRYWHLFVWNRARHEIAGAYRVGASDELIAAYGVRGFYTRTLFSYDRRFLQSLGPALELGRSFVRHEYQRDYGTLQLLWRGIGRFVADRPRYRMLFGPVSISAEYCNASRELLISVLSAARYQSPFGRLVRPLRPVRSTTTAGWSNYGHGMLLGHDTVSEVVAELEADGKGIPVLLRQYLKLNAKLIAFSIDPDFGHVVDGLMVVDLTEVPGPVLVRYMGKDGAASFLSSHDVAARSLPASEPVVVHA